jgi:hypothetical protein
MKLAGFKVLHVTVHTLEKLNDTELKADIRQKFLELSIKCDLEADKVLCCLRVALSLYARQTPRRITLS